MIVLKYELCKIDTTECSQSATNGLCSFLVPNLAFHKTLPVSPFLLCSAVLSWYISISTVRFAVRKGFLGFRLLLLVGEPDKGASGFVNSNLISRTSLWESTYPRPRKLAVESETQVLCNSEYRIKSLTMISSPSQ